MPSWVERLIKHETALIVPECGNVLAPSLWRGLFLRPTLERAPVLWSGTGRERGPGAAVGAGGGFC